MLPSALQRTPPLARNSHPQVEPFRVTLPKTQLSTLILNGKSPAAAKLAAHGVVCEVCSIAAASKNVLVVCVACDSAYHLGCVEPALPRMPFHDWFCGDCATVILRYGIVVCVFAVMWVDCDVVVVRKDCEEVLEGKRAGTRCYCDSRRRRQADLGWVWMSTLGVAEEMCCVYHRTLTDGPPCLSLCIPPPNTGLYRLLATDEGFRKSSIPPPNTHGFLLSPASSPCSTSVAHTPPLPPCFGNNRYRTGIPRRI